MKTRALSAQRLIIAAGIILSFTMAGHVYAQAVSQDWQYFEDVVFETAEDLVASALREDANTAEIEAYQTSIDNLNSILADLHQKKQCPSPETYEAFKYLLETLRHVASYPAGSAASPDFQRDVATLKQAIHASKKPGTASPEPQETPPPQQPTASSKVEAPNPNQPQPPAAQRAKFGVSVQNVSTNEPIREGATLHSGDRYKIIFKPDIDRYLYIFQMDSGNNIFGLFPLEHFRGVSAHSENPARAGQVYYVPAQDKSFKLDQQTGKEQIFFISRAEPDQEFERLYQDVLQAQNEGDRGEMRVAQAKLLRSLNSKKGVASIEQDDAPDRAKVSQQENGASHGNSAEEDFAALRQFLTGDCRPDCLYVLTFMHK